MTNRLILTIATVLFLGTAFEVTATKYAAPEKKEIASSNGEYIIVVSPDTNKHSVKKKGTQKALWEFNQSLGTDDEWVVANDGSKVVWIAWRHVQIDDVKKPCIVIYNKDGKKQQFTYSEVSKPRKRRDEEIGPVGDFWRLWRGFDSVRVSGDIVSIEVIGKKPKEINLKATVKKAAKAPKLKYIVMYRKEIFTNGKTKKGESLEQLAKRHCSECGASAPKVLKIINGFSADFPASGIEKLKKQQEVKLVEKDAPVGLGPIGGPQ